jgi:hydroxyethylthiazole kinase-like uncharacterized protein yjeF
MRSLLEPPAASDNKYTRGVVGFITGSERYPGAALLGIESAFALEPGMVCYQGPAAVAELVLLKRPEVVLGVDTAHALVIGSGVADDEAGAQAHRIAESVDAGKPLVIDAGALQLVDFARVAASALITPHAAEASRLFERLGVQRSVAEIVSKPEAAALDLAKLTGTVVLLKGSLTFLATPAGEISAVGPNSPHLATAGSGDVLAGLIGALVARFVANFGAPNAGDLVEMAKLAIQIHSDAANAAATRESYGASAICGAIGEVVGQLSGGIK